MAESSGFFDNVMDYCPPDMPVEAFRAWLLGDVSRSYFEDNSADEFINAMPKNTSLIRAVRGELVEAWDRALELVQRPAGHEEHRSLEKEYVQEICLLAGLDPTRPFSMKDASKFLAKFVEVSGISVAIGVASVDGALEFAHRNIVDSVPPKVVYLIYSYYDVPHFVRVDDPVRRFGDRFFGLCVGILGM